MKTSDITTTAKAAGFNFSKARRREGVTADHVTLYNVTDGDAFFLCQILAKKYPGSYVSVSGLLSRPPHNVGISTPIL